MAEKSYREVVVKNPDGTTSTVRGPASATDDEILQYAAEQFYKNKQTTTIKAPTVSVSPTKTSGVTGNLFDVDTLGAPKKADDFISKLNRESGAGFVGGIAERVAPPVMWAAEKLGIRDKKGPTLSNLIVGGETPDRGTEARNWVAKQYGVDPTSASFNMGTNAGKLATDIGISTAVGPALGAVSRMANMPKLATALETGGLKALSSPDAALTEKLLNFPTRIAGGAITGGVTGAIIDPESWKTNALIGATLPIGMEALRQPFKYAMEATGPLRESWRTAKGREMFKNWLGEDKARELGNVLTRGVEEGKYLPNSPVTSADILADYNVGKTNIFGSPLMALEGDLANVPMRGISDRARSILRQQQAGRTGVVEDMAGTPEIRKAIENVRASTTAPMREGAFESARLGAEIPKTLVPKMEQSLGEATENVDKVRRYVAAGERAAERAKTGLSASGQPIPPRYTFMDRLAQRADEEADLAARQSLAAGTDAKSVQAQIENLRAANIQPINIENVKRSIQALRAAEGVGINSEKDAILTHILAKLDEATTRGGGIARPGDIDELVKAELQNVAQTLATKRTGVAGGANKHTAELVGSVQKDLISALDEASNGAYSAYRSKFAELSQPLNQLEVGQSLKQKMIPARGREAPQSYITELERLGTEINPKTGKPFLESVKPEDRAALEQIRREYERDMIRSDLTKGINVGDSETALKQGATLPALIMKEISIANFLTKRMNEQAGGRLTEDIALRMLNDPASFAAKYLNDVPPSMRDKVVQRLMSTIRQGVRIGTPVGVSEQQKGQRERFQKLIEGVEQ